MQVREVMTNEVATIEAGETLRVAAERMRTLDVGALPVSEGGHLVGMITDRDITVRAVAEGSDPESVRVADVMTSSVECCHLDESLEEVADRMRGAQIRRLPVVDESKRLVGIVTLADLARNPGAEELVAKTVEEISRS